MPALSCQRRMPSPSAAKRRTRSPSALGPLGSSTTTTRSSPVPARMTLRPRWPLRAETSTGPPLPGIVRTLPDSGAAPATVMRRSTRVPWRSVPSRSRRSSPDCASGVGGASAAHAGGAAARPQARRATRARPMASCYSTGVERASDYDYELPESLIAREPPERRDGARLLRVAPGGAVEHTFVSALPELLPPGSLVVVNDTRVLPARLRAVRPTGGRVELLLCEPLDGAEPDGSERWRAMAQSSKPM